MQTRACITVKMLCTCAYLICFFHIFAIFCLSDLDVTHLQLLLFVWHSFTIVTRNKLLQQCVSAVIKVAEEKRWGYMGTCLRSYIERHWLNLSKENSTSQFRYRPFMTGWKKDDILITSPSTHAGALVVCAGSFLFSKCSAVSSIVPRLWLVW